MIALRGIHHVSLRTARAGEAASRWCAEFGLTERERHGRGVRLACDDEPYCLELVEAPAPGLEHVAWELRRSCSLDDAGAHLASLGLDFDEYEGGLALADPEGNRLLLLPNGQPEGQLAAHGRPAGEAAPGHPRKLGHVNFLTARLTDQREFYVKALGMRLTDYLGDAGVWLHVGPDHHVMALVDKGYSHLHHLAFDVVDIGQMRAALDHLGRHGRWLGWGPVRHAVGGNVASYVRIVEEECFVELYCDMEQLEPHHQPRRYPDDRFSSNTWGSLPPRSYFRFDEAAVASERDSLETLGIPLDGEVLA